MKCPACKKDFKPDPKELAKELGAKGGARSKRTISKEQQRKMQEGRRKSDQF